MKPDSYRPDIDGLRAAAVLPVLIFHLWPDMLPGGYLGVDVFFVISGFLITSILIRQMQEQTFTLRHFWMRRVRRLFPAAAVVTSLAAVAGWFILSKPEWRSLTRQGYFALTFRSNYFFLNNTGNYWGESAAKMPLLHTWSLSIEEQFYLIFPILLFLTVKYRRKWLVPLMMLAALASIARACFSLRVNPPESFYLLSARIWELLAGCILAARPWIPGRVAGKRQSYFSTAGLAIVVASYFIHPFPGYSLISALTVVAGSLLIIAFPSPGTGLANRILSSPPAVFVGRISYSLYLWHWPLIVFANHVGYYHKALLFVISLILGAASFLLVERSSRRLSGKKFLCLFLGGGMLLAGTLSLPFIVTRKGTAYAIPVYLQSISLEPRQGGGKMASFFGDYTGGLILEDRERVDRLDVLVLGDSHSIMFFPAIREACENHGKTLAFYGAGAGTSPFFVQYGTPADYYTVGWTPEERLEFDDYRKKFLIRYKPRVIFVCARWAYYSEEFHGQEDRIERHLEALVKAAPESRFVFVGQPPNLPFGGEGFQSGFLEVPAWRSFDESPVETLLRARTHGRITNFCRDHPRCRFISTEEFFLQNGAIQYGNGRDLYYWDDDHLSVLGAQRCLPIFEKCLEDADD